MSIEKLLSDLIAALDLNTAAHAQKSQPVKNAAPEPAAPQPSATTAVSKASPAKPATPAKAPPAKSATVEAQKPTSATYETSGVREAVIKLASMTGEGKGRQAVLDICAEFGVATARELQPSQWAEFLAAINARIED